jgi:hypothetical protein
VSGVFTEVDVLGAFVPIAVVQLAACVAIFAIADALLTKAGFFRLFWHAPLARFALFVLFFCAIGFALATH